jgi:hypothetical protein
MGQVFVDRVRMDVTASQSSGTAIVAITDVRDISWRERLNEGGDWSCTIPSEVFDPAEITTGRFVKVYDTTDSLSTTDDDDLLFAGQVGTVDTAWSPRERTPRIRIGGENALGLLINDEQDGIVATRSWETPQYTSLVNLRYKLNQSVPEFIDENDSTWANVDLDYKDEEGVDGQGYTHVSRILVAHETPYNKIRLYVRGLNEDGAWIYFPQSQTPRELRVELIDGDSWQEYGTVDTTQDVALPDQPFSKSGFGEISWTPLSLPAQSEDEASGAKGYIIRIRAVHPDHDTMEEPEGGTSRFGANRMQVYIAVPDPNELQSVVNDYCTGFSLSSGSETGSTDGTLWQFYAETSLGILQGLSRRTGFNFVLDGANKIYWFEGYPLSSVLTQSEQTDFDVLPSNYFYVERARRVEGRRPFVTRVTPYGAGSDDAAKVDISKYNAADVTLPAGYAVAGGQVINQTAETTHGVTRHRVIDFPEIGGVDGGTGTTRQLSAELVKAAVAWLQMNYADSKHWRLSGYNLLAGTHPGQRITLVNLYVVDTAGTVVESVNEQVVITEIRHRINEDGLRLYDLEVSNTGAFPPHDWRLLAEMSRVSRQKQRYPQPASQNKLVNSLNLNSGTAVAGEGGESADQVQDNLDAHIAETADAHNIPAQIDAKVSDHAALTTAAHNIPSQIDAKIATHAADEDAHHGRVHDLNSDDHTGDLEWDRLDKTGSDLSELDSRHHADLQGITSSDHHQPVTGGSGISIGSGQVVNLVSPGTLSSSSNNSAPSQGSHTHAISASAAPSGDELLKADGSGGVELDHLTVANQATVYDQLRHVVDGTQYFRAKNVATYRSGNAGLGPYIVINTNLPDAYVSGQNPMLMLDITIWSYSGSPSSDRPPARIFAGMYNYLEGDKRSLSYETTSAIVAGMKVGRNVTTGKLAFIVQLTITPAYPLVYVDVINQLVPAGAWLDGWTIANEADLTGYTSLRNMPYATAIRPTALQTGQVINDLEFDADMSFLREVYIDGSGQLTVESLSEFTDEMHLSGGQVWGWGDLYLSVDGFLGLETGAGVTVDNDLMEDSWVSGLTGWGITKGGAADFRIITADQLIVKEFISEKERALAGEQIISTSVTDTSEPFTPNSVFFYSNPANALTVNDLPNSPGVPVFGDYDQITAKVISREGGGLRVTQVWGAVTDYTDNGDGTQTWQYRPLSQNKWPDPFFNTLNEAGTAGDGYTIGSSGTIARNPAGYYFGDTVETQFSGNAWDALYFYFANRPTLTVGKLYTATMAVYSDTAGIPLALLVRNSASQNMGASYGDYTTVVGWNHLLLTWTQASDNEAHHIRVGSNNHAASYKIQVGNVSLVCVTDDIIEVPAGTFFVSIGQIGATNGIWRTNAIDPAGAPYAQIETLAPYVWPALPGAWQLQSRIGNLSGIAGQSGFGLFAGDPAGQHLTANASGITISGDVSGDVSGDGSGLTDIQGGQVVVAGGGNVNDALSQLENDDSALMTALNALGSKGEQLVTNGDGILGNNTNFGAMTYEGVTLPPGLPGAFRTETYSAGVLSDEFMSINPNLNYQMSYTLKGDPAVGQRHYLGIASFDADKLSVTMECFTIKTGTKTTLAQPYTPGDAVLYLTDGTNWDTTSTGTTGSGYAFVRFGNYTNSAGYNYGEYGYSRFWIKTYGNGVGLPYTVVNGNELHFTAGARTYDPQKPGGGAWPAGTPVCMSWPGGTYQYTAASNVETPNDWTTYTATIGGTLAELDAPTYDTFWPGTAYVRLLMLLNRNVTGSGTIVSGMRFELDKFTAREAVLNWAHNGDITLINGGTIATNTVLADAIAANTITANEIDAETITAEEIAANAIEAHHITADAVTAGKIAAGAISAEKIQVGLLSPNLILNPTFDGNADLWSLTSGATYDTSNAHVGAGCVKLPQYGKALTFKARVVPGQSCVLIFYTSGYYSPDLQIIARGKNAATNDQYITSGIATSGVTVYSGAVAAVAWTQRQCVITPQVGEEWLSLEFINIGTAPESHIQLDSVELKPLVTGTYIKDGSIITNNLAATAIDGMTITGNLIDGATIEGSTIYGGENAGAFTVVIDPDGLELKTEQVPQNTYPTPVDDWSVTSEYTIAFQAAMKIWAARNSANADGDTAVNVIELGSGGSLAIGESVLIDGDWGDVFNYHNYTKVDGHGIGISLRPEAFKFYPVALIYNGSVKAYLNDKGFNTHDLIIHDGGVHLDFPGATDSSTGGLHLAGHSSGVSETLESNNPSQTISGAALGQNEATAPDRNYGRDHWRLYMYDGQLRIVFDDGQRHTVAVNDGGEQPFSFENDWENYSGSWQAGTYWREGQTIFVGGMIKNTTAVVDGEIIATLPVGYRPAKYCMFTARLNTGDIIRIDITSAGAIQWKGGAAASVSFVTLGGISFRVA